MFDLYIFMFDLYIIDLIVVYTYNAFIMYKSTV